MLDYSCRISFYQRIPRVWEHAHKAVAVWEDAVRKEFEVAKIIHYSVEFALGTLVTTG